MTGLQEMTEYIWFIFKGYLIMAITRNRTDTKLVPSVKTPALHSGFYHLTLQMQYIAHWFFFVFLHVIIRWWSKTSWDIPGGASGKEPTCQCRRCNRHRFDPWGRKMPWRRAWQPPAVSLPEESHGQGRLAGYDALGCKESDTTEAA